MPSILSDPRGKALGVVERHLADATIGGPELGKLAKGGQYRLRRDVGVWPRPKFKGLGPGN